MDIGDSDDPNRYIAAYDANTNESNEAAANAAGGELQIAGKHYVIGTNSGDDTLILTTAGGAGTDGMASEEPVPGASANDHQRAAGVPVAHFETGACHNGFAAQRRPVRVRRVLHLFGEGRRDLSRLRGPAHKQICYQVRHVAYRRLCDLYQRADITVRGEVMPKIDIEEID